MKRLILASVLLLSGCTMDATVREAIDKVKEAHDITFEVSEKAYCDSASMGAIKRRFEGNPTRLKQYLEHCGVLNQN